MRLGIYFDGFSSATEILEICHEAEASGVDSLWFAQHMGYREAMIMAAAASAVTKKASAGSDRHHAISLAGAIGGDVHGDDG